MLPYLRIAAAARGWQPGRAGGCAPDRAGPWPRSLRAHRAMAILEAAGPPEAWGSGRGAAHGVRLGAWWQPAHFATKLCV